MEKPGSLEQLEWGVTIPSNEAANQEVLWNFFDVWIMNIKESIKLKIKEEGQKR